MSWLSKDVVKTILWWAIPIIAILVFGLTVRNHIEYVKGLEREKKDLIGEKAEAQSQLKELHGINSENERLANQYRALQKVNRDIGDAEDLIAATRNDFYERLRDDISKNPSTAQCDLSGVQRVLDSLWEREAGS